MNLLRRLMVAMVALALLTAAVMGLLIYRHLTAILIPAEIDRVETHTLRLATALDTYVRSARNDLLAAVRVPAVEGIVRARRAGGTDPRDGLTEAQWCDRLARILAAQLSAKDNYVQFRLIGKADGGREIVRVNRSTADGAIRIVPDAELQRKVDRGYFKEAMAVAANKVYVSPIELNREHEIIETPYMPVARVATLVQASDGQPFGIMIINVDMRPVFTTLRTTINGGRHVYVVNDRGDYLVHPDPAREFGFDLGHPMRVQDELPDLAGLLIADKAEAREAYGLDGQPMGAAWVPIQLADGPRVIVIETVPYEELTASLSSVRRASLFVGLIVVIIALGLAALLARSLVKPLTQMIRAVQAFDGNTPMEVPQKAGGEIGLLARAFERMSADVLSKTQALKQEIVDRRRVEAEKERVAEKERLYSAVVESSDDAILTKTLDGTITGWNPAAERLYGFTAQEAIGQSIYLIVPDNRHEELRTILDQISHGEEVQHIETVRVSKAGKYFTVALTVSPVRSTSGDIIGASAIARDITERKRVEEQLLVSRDQLRRFSARLNTVIEEEGKRIATEVHDLLGGALVGLRHDLELVRKNLEEPLSRQPIEATLARIKEMIGMVTATIHAAKKISTELRPPELDFLGLIPALKSEAQRFEERTRIHLELDLQVEDSAVNAEQATAVFRIFQEALRNIQEHSGATTAHLKVAEDEHRMMLEIIDEGCGITDEERNRANSLGLFGMQERAERVGGWVNLSGVPGQGTTVTVVMPHLKSADP